MRSNFLSIAALTFASLFAAVQADGTQWYVLYTNGTGYQFLNANNNDATLQTTDENSPDAVNGNSIKGERFTWGGTNGFVACQNHEGEYVGFDSSSYAFHSDFSKGHTDALVTITLNSNGSQASLCNSANCIGPNGTPTSEKYMWNVGPVDAV